MKSGVIASAVLHALVLTWGLWSFASPKPLDVSYAEALPVEIVMADVFQGVKGEKKAPITEKPAPKPTSKPQKLPMPAENIGDNEADLDTPPVPDAKPNKVEPTPAPKTAAEPDPVPEEKVAETPPKPAEQKPEPVKPAEQKPVPEEAKPDPIEAAIEKAEAEPEPTPDPAPTPDPVPSNVPVPQQKPKPPKTEVAEAEKPETPKPDAAKTEVAKPDKSEKTRKDKSRDKKVADQTAPADSEFDSDKIAALLTKEKASGGGAKRSTDQASLGSTRTTGSTLSRSEIGELQGLIKEQMAKCWSPPTGVSEAGSLRISIEMTLDPSGALQGVPSIVEGGGGSSVERVAAEAALRAVRRCSPYNLPSDKYEAWAEVKLNFDPSEMY